MGDRAFASIKVSETHAEQFPFCIYGFVSENEEDGIVTFVDEEADYGAQSIRDDLRSARIPFYGYHESGAEYAGAVFAFDGQLYAECATHLDANGPVVDVGPDGPDPEQLSNALRYWSVHENTAQVIHDRGAK
jgi:hypothetical protein